MRGYGLVLVIALTWGSKVAGVLKYNKMSILNSRLTTLLVTHEELASLVWLKLFVYVCTTRGYELKLLNALNWISRLARTAKYG